MQSVSIADKLEVSKYAEPLCLAVILSNATNVHLSKMLIIHVGIGIALNDTSWHSSRLPSSISCSFFCYLQSRNAQEAWPQSLAQNRSNKW